MKKMKTNSKTRKIISVFITLAMLISLLPTIPVSAEETGITEYYCLDVGAGAYINTGFTPTSDTRVVMEAEVNDKEAALFGTHYWVGDKYYMFHVNSGGEFYGAGFGLLQSWAFAYVEPERQTIQLDNDLLKIDGEAVTYTDPMDGTCTFAHEGHPMYLFAISLSGNAQTFENQYIRFYSCKIYEDNTLVRDLVPAKQGNNIGVYDRKYGVFYANQGGGYMSVNSGRPVDPEIGLTDSNEGVYIDFDGTITVSRNTTINALPMQSGISIAPGRNVTIEIKKDVTLTVTGGEAVGRFGGGAGIEVPVNSSLTLCGFGTLDVTGGMAAVGGEGGKGGDGAADYYMTSSGAGGNGGYGGGGAGAGIGGRGGNGGLGGNGGRSVSGESYESTALISGQSGSVGKDGIAGNGCGNISICYTLNSENVYGGAASSTPSQGGARGNVGRYTYTRTYLGFDGGGGGAGGNGHKGADIGSGGGGGGGSGLIISWYYTSDADITRGTGHAGVGGYGAVKGNNGWDNGPENNSYGLVAGLGALGGDGGGDGVEKEPEYFYAVTAIPQAAENLIYNGKEQNGIINLSDIVDKCTVEGTVSAKDVGAYSATFSLKDNCVWSDGTFDDKTVNWSVATHIISVPQAEANLVYNGEEQVGVPEGEGYTIFNNAKTNAGYYSAKVVLKYGYCWEGCTTEDKAIAWSIAKQKVTVSSETIYVHYSGAERTVLADTNLYTVENGTVPAFYLGELYPSLTLRDAKNYTWENSDAATIDCHTINVHEYSQGDAGCGVCGKAESFHYDIVPYLDRTVSDDSTVITEEKSCVDEMYITEDDKEWGLEELSTVWYVVKDDIELKYRPAVRGDVRIILMNEKTLTANAGITVEEGGTLRIYAQSDDESLMGKLIGETEGVTAIGGRDGADRYGENGLNGGNVYFYGGAVSLKSTGSTCIGGGNGGSGHLSNGKDYNRGRGGTGGNCGEVDFYGGTIDLESTNAACIGGGNGGNGSQIWDSREVGPEERVGADGGIGGDGNRVNFYGGDITIISENAACIGGGTGGKGGTGGSQSGANFQIDVASSGGSGGNGGNCGSVSFCGAAVSLISSGGTCIGGGNGGTGGSGGQGDKGGKGGTGGDGGNGGTGPSGNGSNGIGGKGGAGGTVSFCDTAVSIESTNGVCIGGGNGANGRHGGNGGNGGTVYFRTGTVSVISENAACIGGGNGGIADFGGKNGVCGSIGKVYFDGGNTTLISENSAVIGTGGSVDSIVIGEDMTVYDSKNETVTLPDNSSWGDLFNGMKHVKVSADLAVPYRYYDIDAGEFKDGECLDYEVIDQTMYVWDGFKRDKWYVVKGKVKIEERVQAGILQSGGGYDVHLILTDGCELTVENGIESPDGNSLSIYAQEGGSGILNAGNMDLSAAGIGGGYGKYGGTGGIVNIHGGVVTATSWKGAGIGGGCGDKYGGNGGTVNIFGGEVTATSWNGAGIGGGCGERIGEPATVTLGDNMVVSEGGVGNSYNSVKIVEKVPELDSLTVPGAQIRLSGSQGLRFVGEIPESVIRTLDDQNGSMLDNKNFSEDYGYGFIVLPKDILGDNELTFDTENIAVVPANNVYEVGADYVRFTVCIVDILPKNYKREYTVRPYIRYTQNGETKTLYGEQYGTSVYSVADAAYKALGDEKTPQAILDILFALD